MNNQTTRLVCVSQIHYYHNRIVVKNAISFVLSGLVFYGNAVIQRSKWSENQGKKSWMEPEYSLPTGVMAKFMLYVDPSANLRDLGPMRLQVWTPVNESLNLYRLRWERRVILDKGVGRKYEVNVL